MTRAALTPWGEVIPLRTGYITEAEQQFNADLHAESARLSAQYDYRPDLFNNRDPFDQRGQHEWRHKVERRLRWQRVVRAFCVAVAVFAIVYMGGQEFLR
jgi:hypothetical protein